jgi:hypothetical protein
LVFFGCLVSLSTGCNSSDPASETVAEHGHDHDLDFGGAIGQIEELAATIGDALAAGDMDTAHDPLHEIAHLLEDLPDLAQHAGLSDADQASVKAAANKLMDAYGAIDEQMHGEEGKSYDSVKDDIAAGLESLESFEHTHE